MKKEDHNTYFARNWQIVTIVCKDGSTFTGSFVGQTDKDVTIHYRDHGVPKCKKIFKKNIKDFSK